MLTENRGFIKKKKKSNWRVSCEWCWVFKTPWPLWATWLKEAAHRQEGRKFSLEVLTYHRVSISVYRDWSKSRIQRAMSQPALKSTKWQIPPYMISKQLFSVSLLNINGQKLSRYMGIAFNKKDRGKYVWESGGECVCERERGQKRAQRKI